MTDAPKDDRDIEARELKPSWRPYDTEREKVAWENYFAAHRAAWALHHGKFPNGSLDHVDGNRANNVITNLRIAPGNGNAQNIRMKRCNTSGVKGAFWHKKNKRWMASIKVKAKSVYLGSFETAMEAAHAYNKAAIELYGEFAVLNPVGV